MESILKMTDLQLVRRYNMKIIACLVCHIPSLRNALALKAAPQARAMAQRTARHTSSCETGGGSSSWSQDRQEAPHRGWAHGGHLCCGDCSIQPPPQQTVCCSVPFCSTSEHENNHGGPKNVNWEKEKGPCDSNQTEAVSESRKPLSIKSSASE